MGHVFRQSYTVLVDGQRQLRESKKWYVEYTDASGKRRRVPGYRDRQATEHLLAELEKEAAQIRAGLLPPEAGLLRQPLADHLEAYADHLRAKNGTAPHVALVQARCTSVLDGCGFVRWCDLDAHQVERFLAQLRAQPRGADRRRPGLAVRTTNHYLQQFTGFVGWLARRLKVADPLAELAPLNADVDRRHVRRALPEAEFAALVAAAAGSAAVVHLQPGPDRAMLYVVAAYTGLRASELASLTPEQLQLAGAPATLTVAAGYSKRRRQDTLPVHPDLAGRLRAWLAGRPAGQPLWPGEWAAEHHAAKMLRHDLKAAGVAYRDPAGRVFDFHALRGQFITGLARAGVPLVYAQKLARHSDPRLTANFYSHLETRDLAQEARKLPPPPASGQP